MKPIKKKEELIKRIKDALENYEAYEKLPAAMERMINKKILIKNPKGKNLQK
jgi:hypothetical protein